MTIKWFTLVLLLGITLSNFATADDERLRFCSTLRFAAECEQMDRGNSEVRCQRVQDSIECAQRILNNTADFGIFDPESVMQISSLAYDGLTVVKELRHMDRSDHPVDYQSVVVVQRNHTGGVSSLRGAKFCHPGLFYDHSQRWSERFLKHFERTVVQVECDRDGVSPAEIEASAMSRFFSSACRPGAWSNDRDEDARLKERFPNLCELCDPNSNTCAYPDSGRGSQNSHASALRCLVRGGSVAYTALEVALEMFGGELRHHADNYAFLCPNGTLQAVSSLSEPCVWLRQPWRLIVSSDSTAVQIPLYMNNWFNSGGRSEPWQDAIKSVITAESSVIHRPQSLQRLRDYARTIREIPIDFNFCNTRATWCTTSTDEYEKCRVVSAGGLTAGVLPTIECREPRPNVVACLNDIASKGSDMMGIDSNYGFLARQVYNLTGIMYAETESNRYSTVVILVRADASVRGIESLRDSKVCFPEYGGIAKVAFINAAKADGVFPEKNCNFSSVLGDFFGESCVPGARDSLHDPSGHVPDNLCSLCRYNIQPLTPEPEEDASVAKRSIPDGEEEVTPANEEDAPAEDIAPAAEDPEADDPPAEDEPQDDDDYDQLDEEEREKRRNSLDKIPGNCNPDSTNRYYGNQGALRCLSEVGDVAVVELQYLKLHAQELLLDPNNFRVLCRNGSLAAYTGFDVDKNCTLTTIVDGEIVTRRDSTKRQGIVNALISFDEYFRKQPDFKMYNIFAGVKHLLFKDSTIGLVPANTTGLSTSVQNYIDLFENVEACQRGSAVKLFFNNFLILIIALVALTRFR